MGSQVGREYDELITSNYNSIITLRKASNNLNGQIPNGILKMNNLQDLDISDNQFIGEVLDELKSKFGVDSFKENLFSNMSNQKQLLLGTI